MSWSSALNWIKGSRLITGTQSLYHVVTHSRGFKVAAKGYNIFCLYHLWESAVSHLLVVDTCRHGTSPLGYLGISIKGGQPKYGNTGGEAGARATLEGNTPNYDKSINKFYVASDSRFLTLTERIEIRYRARVYAQCGGISLFGIPKGSAPAIICYASWVFGRLVGLLTPTLKFHFRPGSYENFEKDEYKGINNRTIAIRTGQPVSIKHLGITGSLTQGLNTTLPKRIIDNPSRFCLGGIQAALAVCLAAKMVGRPLALPVPTLLNKMWDYRAFRWPIEYGIRLSAW